MPKKKFPYIRITSVSTNGNYYGAYENSDVNSKKGYVIFIAHNNNTETYCECMGYIHGKTCYHIKGAIELENIIYENNMDSSPQKSNSKKESGEEGEDGK